MNEILIFWTSLLTFLMVLGFADIHRRLRVLERRVRGSGLVVLLQVVHVGLSGGLTREEMLRVMEDARDEHEALRLLMSYMRGRVDNPEIVRFADAVDIVTEFLQ